MTWSNQEADVKLLDSVLRPGGLELTKRLVDYCAFKPGDRLVDIGCGVGTTVEYLCQLCDLDAVGIDSSAKALQIGKRRSSDLQLIQAAGEQLPFSDASVDGVLAECSLSILKYSREVLTEINRVLAIGGKLAISDLYIRNGDNVSAKISNVNYTSCISGARTYHELVQLLDQFSFKILIWEDHTKSLKEFAARYIMEYGSLADFWQCSSKSENGKHTYHSAMKKSLVGYYLLVAEKTSHILAD